jgi:hypothetical protein
MEYYREVAVKTLCELVTAFPVFGSKELGDKVKSGIKELLDKTSGTKKEDSPAGGFKIGQLIGLGVALVIFIFVMSCIEQFAQAWQRGYDAETVIHPSPALTQLCSTIPLPAAP